MQEQVDKIKQIQDEQGILIREIHTAIKGNDLGTKGIAKDIACNKMKIAANISNIENNKTEINDFKKTSVIFGSAAGGGILGLVEAVKAWFAYH
jgi:hypothetical protein